MGEIINLNLQWRFHLGDEPGADYMGWDDRAWREVTLPHDWSVEHPFDRRHSSGTGYLPGGTAWYRKHVYLSDAVAGRRARLTFGGVYRNAQVWFNSNYLGRRPYGYATFTYDVSAFIRPGENVIAVRVEHEETADSRWFTGSGIYRDVTLELSDMHAFETDGVFVTTEEIADGAASVRVRYQTMGCESARFEILDDHGRVAARSDAEGERGEALLRVSDAALWSPNSPALYALQAEAVRGGRATDVVRIPFGIRMIRFDGDEGFFLNGESTKLKGVCVHHDGGALGAAVPKAVWRRRLLKLKAMGCNALRTAHNPPDSHLLDLCDELGFLVMDEAFDEWEGAKNKWWQGHNVYPPKRFGYAMDFPQWHRADLEGMVRRDRNHPSVILWSIGNELDYPNDPYVTPLFDEVLGNNDANKPAAERRYDPRKPDAGRLAVIARELAGIVHALDVSRPVTSALSFPELSNRTGFADALDVVGYNYKEHFYAQDHAAWPGRVIYGSENGKGAAEWAVVRDNAYICGQFLWAGVDFLGECAGWPVRISQAGLMDLAGFEKPVYYHRKAMWSGEPFVKLSSGPADGGKDDLEREGFAWEGEPGQLMRVSACSNQNEAELFLNGASLGKKKLSEGDGCRVSWEVPYQAGTLRVAAGACEDALSSPEPASVIELRPDTREIAADGQAVVQVEVFLRDASGRETTRDQAITYQLTGDGEIIGVENGRPDDLTPYSSRRRLTLNGRSIVYVRAGTRKGTLTLHAFGDAVEGACAIRTV